MYTVHNPALFTCKDFYLDAWGMHNQEDERYIGDAIKEGLEIFEKTFGFKSKSAIAACFSMTEYAEKVLSIPTDLILLGRWRKRTAHRIWHC
jgi:hypothetical protein